MRPMIPIILVATAAISGCATKEYVHEHVEAQLVPVGQRLDVLEARASMTETRVDTAEAGLHAQGRRLDAVEARNRAQDENLAEIGHGAREALDRALAAGKLAEGKLVFATVLTQPIAGFDSDSVVLGQAAKAALDALAAQLRAENRNVYIEIQGHTDATGDPVRNLRLGEARAEAVRRHLHGSGLIPLHRMAVISYGETMPAADNASAEGRMANRRVVLVVLK